MTDRMAAGSGPAATDFMAHGYDLIDEPLNLRDAGRRWLSEAWYSCQRTGMDRGLVLGATPWIATLLGRTHRHVSLVDLSEVMLANARAVTTGVANPGFVRGRWLALPFVRGQYDSVISDNGFSYLSFPDGWTRLCDELAALLRPGGCLLARALSVAEGEHVETVAEVAARFSTVERINFTEVRAALLFSQWRERTFAIDTESALHAYDAHASAFAPLLARCPPGEPNDLVTIEKYRGAGAVYYAPPLEEWLRILRRHFRVQGVHYGPYAMSRFFPLVAAVRV
jgi:SAM-dependent methyltransferase